MLQGGPPTMSLTKSGLPQQHHYHHDHYYHHQMSCAAAATSVASGSGRKRKAEPQDSNERLSKRLSLLNLEQNGQKLYVPVENPGVAAVRPPTPTIKVTSPPQTDDSMHLDDTKHKVYIYSLDDELSSDSEPEDGRLVFLPDIERHLRAHRLPPSAANLSIPRPVPASPEGELAGMQVVLYSDPASLTVPQERDSVRRAIIEARTRTRERQRREREGTGEVVEMPPRVDPKVFEAASLARAFPSSSSSSPPAPLSSSSTSLPPLSRQRYLNSLPASKPSVPAVVDPDPDVMELD